MRKSLVFAVFLCSCFWAFPLYAAIQLSASTSSYGAWQVSCDGASDGSIDLTVSGAVLPVSILWSDGDTSEDRSGLTAGQYDVVVTDFSGQTASLSILLQAPPPIVITNDSIRPASCPLTKSGFIRISVSGGVSPYNYAWSNGSVVQDNDSLRSGTYTLTVTDQNACSVVQQFQVGSFPPLSVADSIQPVSCPGYSDGGIDISVSGGISPFRYDWSNGSTTQDIASLASGMYTVLIRYGGGCRDTVDFYVNEPDSILLNPVVNDATCAGDANGSVLLAPSGGNPPYTVFWNDGSSGFNVSGLIAGAYTATLTDQLACTSSAIFTISEPPVLTAYGGLDRLICGDTVRLNASVPGVGLGYWSSPNEPAVYFSDPNAADALALGLPTGPIVLRWTVTAGPCLAEDDVVILRRSDADCTPRLNLPNAITPNQDGFNDVYEISEADDFPDLELMVFDRVGHLLFEAKPYRNDWPGTDSSGSPLNPGTYYVRLVSVFGGIQYNTFVDVIR